MEHIYIYICDTCDKAHIWYVISYLTRHTYDICVYFRTSQQTIRPSKHTDQHGRHKHTTPTDRHMSRQARTDWQSNICQQTDAQADRYWDRYIYTNRHWDEEADRQTLYHYICALQMLSIIIIIIPTDRRRGQQTYIIPTDRWRCRQKDIDMPTDR